jgi:hypothetical protein
MQSTSGAETNVQYSRFRWDYSNANNGSTPQVVVLNPNDETIAVLEIRL